MPQDTNLQCEGLPSFDGSDICSMTLWVLELSGALSAARLLQDHQAAVHSLAKMLSPHDKEQHEPPHRLCSAHQLLRWKAERREMCECNSDLGSKEIASDPTRVDSIPHHFLHHHPNVHQL